MNNTFNLNIAPRSLATGRHFIGSHCTPTHGFGEPNVLNNVRKVSRKNRKDIELKLIWKDHVAHLSASKIYVYEENTDHATACECCTHLSVCNKNDEERQRRRTIESKMKWSDACTEHMDRRILFSKVNISTEQKSESLTMQFSKCGVFNV